MIIIRISGGLGNQMFQYAFYEKLKSIGKNVKLDISFYEGKNVHNGFELGNVFKFKLNDSIADVSEIAALNDIVKIQIVKFLNCIFPKLISKKYFYYLSQEGCKAIQYNKDYFYIDNVRIFGYWQSEKYFADIKHIISEKFSFNEKLEDTDLKLRELMEKSGYESVSMHIRRGDYLGTQSDGVCNLEYYERAQSFINEKLSKPRYFIFSDDIEWCKNNLSINNAVYVEGNSGRKSYIDMRLMTYCKHHIIANSSFSWWGAWLGECDDSLIIAPAKWFNNTTSEKEDVIPTRWIRL